MRNGISTLQAVLRDPARLQSLRDTQLLDTGIEKIFDRLTDATCRKLGVSMAAISLVEPHRQFFKSESGFNTREMGIQYSLCQYVVHEGSTVILNDARERPEFENHPVVVEKGLMSYLGVPLFVRESVIGAFCAADTKPRTWTPEDIRFVEHQAIMARAEIFAR